MQIFNVNETVLFEKCILTQTFLAEEVENVHGYKVSQKMEPQFYWEEMLMVISN